MEQQSLIDEIEKGFKTQTSEALLLQQIEKGFEQKPVAVAPQQSVNTPQQQFETNDKGYTQFAEIQQDIDHKTLQGNDSWIKGSQNFFKMTYGYVPQVGDEELEGYDGESYREKIADYGLKQMAGFNFNIGDMAIDTKRVMSSDQEMKESFVYMLDQYDAVNTSWHTASQAGWEMFTDVTNWAGVLTLGTAAVASQTAKFAGKKVLSETIKASLKKSGQYSVNAANKIGLNSSMKRAGALAGTEGALHAGLSDSMQQNVRIDAGAQDEYSVGQTAAMTGIGLVGGAILGSGLDYGISKTAKHFADKKLAVQVDKVREEIAVDVAKGARKAQEIIDNPTTMVTEAIDNGASPEEIQRAFDIEVAGRSSTIPVPRSIETAKPTYNYGQDNPIELDFKDPIAKALFMVGTKTPSKKRDEFMRFLQQNGVTDIFQKAQAMRDSIKAQAKSGQTKVELSAKPKRQVNAEARVDKIVDEPTVKADSSDPRPPKARATPRLFHNAFDLMDVMSDPNSVGKVIDDFEKNQYTPKEYTQVLRIANEANELMGQDVLKLHGLMSKGNLSEVETKSLNEQIEKALALYQRGAAVREHVNAYSGRNLQAIQDYMNYRKNIGEPLKEEEINAAHTKLYKKEVAALDAKYEAEIDAIGKDGKPNVHERLVEVMKRRESDPTRLDLLNELDKRDPLGNWKGEPSTTMEKLVELSISGVFSPSTVVYNTVWPMLKTYAYPALDTIFDNPLSLMKWRKTLRVYAQMFGATAAAKKSARAAAAYEQTLLTQDPQRFYEGGIKIDGKIAGFLRTFPRLLGSSDAYNQEIASTAVLAANAFDSLATKAHADGLRGAKLRKYVDDNIKAEIDKGYDYDMTINKLKPFYEKGKSLKYTGKKLEDYVLKEMKKTGTDGMRRLKDADALDAVQTLLYKKEFRKDGDGFTGKVEHYAAKYEDFVKDNPWSKFFGNLFFRTPAWLFNESLRLTPAVNGLLPQFKNDLSGANGIARQNRAKTEAAVGYAWMLYVATKWAQGEMTGSPELDYTKKGERNRSTMRPLTIKDPFFLDGGKEVEFRRWEPLRIPATIVINALEGYMDHTELKNMNGYEEGDGVIPDDVMAGLGIAFATAIAAFKDSSLTQGVTDTIGTAVKLTGFFEDPNGEDQQKGSELLGNFLVKKGTMIAPSTIKKSQEAFMGQDELTSIVGMGDRWTSLWTPNATSIPRQYDIFGNVAKRPASYTQITGFGYAKADDLSAGRSEDEMAVLDYVADLEELGFGSLTRAKYRDARFGKTDLRTIDTTLEDGSVVSVFDAMMQQLQKNRGALVDALLPLTTAHDMPLGSPRETGTYGIRVKKTKEFINNHRNQALDMVIARDETLRKQSFDRTIKNLNDSQGRYNQ